LFTKKTLLIVKTESSVSDMFDCCSTALINFTALTYQRTFLAPFFT